MAVATAVAKWVEARVAAEREWRGRRRGAEGDGGKGGGEGGGHGGKVLVEGSPAITGAVAARSAVW